MWRRNPRKKGEFYEQSGECETSSQTWRACGLHLCPPPFVSWQDEKCADEMWVITMSRDAPCSLDCRSVDQPGVVQRFSNLVQDGTVCGEGALKICLAGVCEEVGVIWS